MIDKMVYVAAKIAKYGLRIPTVNDALAENGVNTLHLLLKRTNKTKLLLKKC